MPVGVPTSGARSSRERPDGVDKAGGGDRTVAAGRAGSRRPVRGAASESRPAPSGTRVFTGVVLVAAAAVILRVGGKPGAVALVTIVGLVAVQELFTGLRQRGFLPAILPVLVGVAFLPLVAYKRGPDGILVVLTLAVLVSMLWFLLGPVRDRPVVNIAVSMLGLVYVGFFVSLAGLILQGQHGLGVLVGVIVGAAAHDVAGLFVGKNMGRVPIAPEVSPNKTIEGLLGGVIVAVLVSVVYAKFSAPFEGDLSAGVFLAISVGLLAPLGDLVESMLKRDLGIKDMGTLLPGHGGVLDRIDAMLFVLPGVFLLAKFKGWL